MKLAHGFVWQDAGHAHSPTVDLRRAWPEKVCSQWMISIAGGSRSQRTIKGTLLGTSPEAFKPRTDLTCDQRKCSWEAEKLPMYGALNSPQKAINRKDHTFCAGAQFCDLYINSSFKFLRGSRALFGSSYSWGVLHLRPALERTFHALGQSCWFASLLGPSAFCISGGSSVHCRTFHAAPV